MNSQNQGFMGSRVNPAWHSPAKNAHNSAWLSSPKNAQNPAWQPPVTRVQGWYPDNGTAAPPRPLNMHQPNLTNTPSTRVPYRMVPCTVMTPALPSRAAQQDHPAQQDHSTPQRVVFSRPLYRISQIPMMPPFTLPRLHRPRRPIFQHPRVPLLAWRPQVPRREQAGTVDVSHLHRPVQDCAGQVAFPFRRKTPLSPAQETRIHFRRTEKVTLQEEGFDTNLDDSESDVPIPPAIQRAMRALVSHTPEGGNAFAAFLLGYEEPAKVIAYWEGRRIQNSLRRFLERMEESKIMVSLQGKERVRFRVVHDSFRPQKQNEQLVPVVFRKILVAAKREVEEWIEQKEFIDACEKFKLWPPELEMADKVEVFCALCVTSRQSARNFRALYGRRGLDWMNTNVVITQQTFCQGLSDVPFNLPDFPVPEHYFDLDGRGRPQKGSLKIDVAAAIASLFLPESDGMDSMKDFFSSDLVSVEEIQVALPRLWPVKLVVEACTWIIRCAVPHFTNEQWNILVKDVRQRNYDDSLMAQTTAQLRQLEEEMESMPMVDEDPKMYSPRGVFTGQRDEHTGRKVPVTCPLPPREINEQCVQWDYSDPAQTQAQLVDWTHPSEIAPADQGAGGQAPSKFSIFAINQAANTDVMWLSAELHSEIRGPFLALAFGKCCELYDSRCDTRRANTCTRARR
eukprot:GEMP01020462.1.p1 GENE.GEMP01020462.1~~GEMP01020462.1.p1  ORF type:complete len:680 (+),score=151.72 GEMP01020462.1:400-2439(+)